MPVAMSAKEIMAISMSGQAEQDLSEDDLRKLVFEIVNFEGDCPTRITDVVNRVSNWTPHLTRRDRDRAKLSAFRMIGRMVRAGVLRRVARHYVLIAPQKEEPQAPARRLDPIELPEPRL